MKRWPRPLRELARCLAGDDPPDPDVLDRAAFADLAIDRHRVAPLIAASPVVSALPGPEQARMRQSADAAAFAALAQKAETRRLLAAFDQAGCTPVLFKGWPLAERLYGSASLRHSKDIDLHIPAAELPRAVECLEALGYAPLPGHATRFRLATAASPVLIAETNDIALIDRAGNHVELHWRLTHLRGWLTLADFPDPVTTHPIDRSGVAVHVPTDQTALIYLAVHGQLHMWGRLKWLVDIARLVERRSDGDLMADLALASRLGAGRALRVAVGLSNVVLGSRIPPGWPAASWLERRAIAHFCGLIAAPGGEPGRAWARMQYHLCVMALGEGVTQRLASPRYAFWRNLRLYLAGRGMA
ncbi:MAG: nucleotidyltransferase family protein [Pseudomonadota bacterium]